MPRSAKRQNSCQNAARQQFRTTRPGLESLERRELFAGLSTDPLQPVFSVNDPAGGIMPVFEWKMTDRFGKNFDLNQNGIPDMPNTREYVQAAGGYQVTLDATKTTIPTGLAKPQFQWPPAPAWSSVRSSRD